MVPWGPNAAPPARAAAPAQVPITALAVRVLPVPEPYPEVTDICDVTESAASADALVGLFQLGEDFGRCEFSAPGRACYGSSGGIFYPLLPLKPSWSTLPCDFAAWRRSFST